MVSGIISRVVILVFGTLYPAYSSYKAVKSRNGRDYVKWMMYWIVFALFTAVETFADVFISWIPFYYEIKILFVIWLLSPATKGSSFLYRKFVHPQLMKREKDIDEYITQVTDKGCTALLQIGSKGLNMCATTVMQTAIKGQSAVVDHLRKSYSMNDLSDPNAKYPDPGSDNDDDEQDETDYYGPRKQQLGYTKEKARSSRQHQHDLSRVIEQEEEVEPVRRRSGRDKERTSSTGHISTRSTFSRSTSSTSSTSSSAASTTVPGGTQYRWMTRLGYNKSPESRSPVGQGQGHGGTDYRRH